MSPLTRRELLKAGAASAGAVAMPAVAQAANAVATPAPLRPPVRQRVSLEVNGETVEREVDTRTTLLDFLREELHLTGTKKGCDHGQCGSCTVLRDGRRVTTCQTFASSDNNGADGPRFKIAKAGGWVESYPTADQKVAELGTYNIEFDSTSKEIKVTKVTACPGANLPPVAVISPDDELVVSVGDSLTLTASDSSDEDGEVQDPMRLAVREILGDPTIQSELAKVAESVKTRLDQVAGNPRIPGKLSVVTAGHPIITRRTHHGSGNLERRNQFRTGAHPCRTGLGDVVAGRGFRLARQPQHGPGGL